MSSLTVFKTNDGIELVIDTQTGEAFATQAGYSRMSGKASSTISERLKGVRSDYIRMAEILTAGGLQGVRLIPAKLVYKWLLKDNIGLAEAMGEVGATVYIHQLAGYKITSIEKPQSTADMLLMYAQAFKEQEQRLQSVEAKLVEVQEISEIHELEIAANTCELERFKNGHGNWYSIIGYASLKNIKDVSIAKASALGRKASAIARANNIKPEVIPDPRFGTVQCYPDWILSEVM